METNNVNRAPTENRPPSAGIVAGEAPGPGQFPPRPPLNRVDSRSGFPPVVQRPATPLLAQQRPQFQPGGPVSGQPQFAPRPGPPLARGPAPPGPPQQVRAQPPPLRPSGPQSFAPQGPRPLQSPTAGQPPLRGFPPNNLQFGPRPGPQIAGAVTPDGARPPPQLAQLPNNGVPRNGPPQNPASGQLSRQSSQGSLKGLDTSNPYQNKAANLDNQGLINQNVSKPENGAEMLAPKARSYSIAAAPGTPSPLKVEDDRRKSVSSIGGRVEDYASRSPGLGLIQEGKIDSKENVRNSVDNVKSGVANDGERDVMDRPESRISGSKMTDSFIGALPTVQKKKMDDDDDVVLQNSVTTAKVFSENSTNQIKTDTFDRSPSLTRSDDSPELKQKPAPGPVVPNKSQSATPEPQRPKTPKTEIKPDMRSEQIQGFKTATPPPPKTISKSPVLESKPPVGLQKPTDLNTSSATADSKRSTPRRIASAPKSKPKDGDNDSGVDESTQGNDLNGSPGSPNKKTPSKLPTKEKSSSSLKPSLSRSSSKSATVKTPENPLPNEKKKVPMNKVQVGNAPSPNLKTVKSKIGSLDNATYKPGGGKVKIENRKLDFNKAAPKIAAKNDAYTPSGGSKKITTTKLEWNAKSKIGSLQNTAYKPGGGDKKIETVKLDFKDKAKPKVASTVNITHKPGGGAVKDHYYMGHEWSEDPRPLTRCRSARAPRTPRTPRTPRALSPRKHSEDYFDEDRVERNNERNIERNRRSSMARPASARTPLRSACARPTSITQRPAFTIY